MTNISLICYFQILSVKGQTGIKLHQNLFPDVKYSLISSVMSILLISIERSVNLVFLDRCYQMVERGKYFKNCFYVLPKFSSLTIGSFRGTDYDIVQISFRNIFLCEKTFFLWQTTLQWSFCIYFERQILVFQIFSYDYFVKMLSKLEKADIIVRPCLLFCNVSSNVRLFFILSLVKTVIIAY